MRGYDYTEEFEFGLEFILDGLERLKSSGVNPGVPPTGFEPVLPP